MKNESSESIYLYCLARSNLLQFIDGTGVDGKNPLFLQNFRDIAAVISMVSLSEFCGQSAESRMQDLSWIGPRACRHEEVVQQVLRHSPVLPATFGTIFSSIESFKKCLETNYYTILSFLDKVADKEEWSVKGLIDKSKAKEIVYYNTLAKEAECLASLSPGMRYFQEQRIQSKIEKELNGWLKDICIRIENDLNRYASDFYERKTLPRGVTGNDMDMILNWAFLVPRGSVEDFRARIDLANTDHTHQGIVFKLSGPWPPYSFCLSLSMEEKG